MPHTKYTLCDFDKSGRQRHPAWAKLIAIKRVLKYYEKNNENVVILYLDTDAYIADHSLRISSPSAPIAIWEVDDRGQYCSGSMLIKSSTVANNIIDEWWNNNDTLHDVTPPWEQDVLNIEVRPKRVNDIHMLPSFGWRGKGMLWDSGLLLNESMNHKYHQPYNLSGISSYKTFIHHLWAGLKFKNIPYLRKEVHRLQAPLLSSTDFVYCVNSSTILCATSK